MAKLCSPFGTSPPIASSFDLTPNCFNDDYFISADPFDFLDDLPSICGDIQKMGSDLGNSDTSSYGDSGMDLDDFDIKPEIRNTDLMWSAPPSSILSTSASSMCSDISSAAPLSAVMGNLVSNCKTDRILSQHQQQPQRPQPTVVTAKKFTNIGETVMIKQESDLEQQLETHSITNIKVQTTNIQNMPPGTSLLRKSNNQQQKKQQSRNTTAAASSMHITKRGDQLLACATTNPSAQTYNNTSLSSSSSSSLNTSNCSSQSASSLYQRPDTPHSLDDDCSTPEFRHNVDLRACVMGSNNISLTADPTNFINHVSQELQDTSKKQIDTRLISGCSLTDVLDVINSGISDATTTSQSLAVTATSTGGKLMNGGGGGGYSNCLLVNTSGSLRSTDCDSDEESMEGSSTASLLDQEIMFGAGGVSPVSSQSSNISSTHNYMQHSDHSYTRCKDGIDDISTNLETPSDSEEEIDVVSITDKKLPTNPSDKDRRALQTKVAHKFNAARIVKTPNGIRTIPPRRRGSYELPYTPASNSPVKSVNNSRFPSPAATPYQNQYTTKYVHQQQQQMMSVVVADSAIGTPLNILATDKSRKRLLANGAQVNATIGTIINGEVISGSVLPPSKKHRGKKTKHVVSTIQLQQTPSGVLNRTFSVDETADTIEKRNLHNDMERQRRIGLKNLFEALKKQIPSIKDKERAPKVNILREAAKLCEALTREDQQLCEQKAKLKEELRRKQELLNQLRQQQHD